MNSKLLKWVNVFMFAVVIIVNVLASLGKINKLTPGNVSDSVNVLITPAGYVFSIWGLIYFLLLVFVIYQAMPKYENTLPVKAVGYYFSITCLLNVCWIFAWHYQKFTLSLLIMILLLLTLILIMIQMYKLTPSLTNLEKRVFKLPFSVYLGWISVATIANVSFVLANAEWSRFSIRPDFWAVIILFVIMLLGITVLTLKNDKAYVWVLVWALIGIAVKNANLSPLIVNAAFIMIAFLLRNLLASYLSSVVKTNQLESPIKKQHPKKK